MICASTGRFLFLAILGAVCGAGSPYPAPDEPIEDEEIKPLYFEHLTYPLAARVRHVSGVVVVRLKLDDRGGVVSAEALSGARSLIVDTLANAKKWRFRPNRTGAVVLVYRFVIEGLCNLPCPSDFRFHPPNLAIVRIGEAVVDHSAGEK